MSLMIAITMASPQNRPVLSVAGDWQVRIEPGTVRLGKKLVSIKKTAVIDVEPATLITVRDEKVDGLPIYDVNAAPWVRGARLKEVITSETTVPDMLVADSLRVKSGPGDAEPYKRETDYQFEEKWGTFGRVVGGAIPEGGTVYVDYETGRNRQDVIVVNTKGQVSIKTGVPNNATPKPPGLQPDEAVVTYVWVPGRTTKLTEANLYPVIEPEYPEPVVKGAPQAAKLLPKTWAKLQKGEPLSILAWGDSVTAGGEASDEAHRWQNQFVALLGGKFPKSNLKLTTAGWGGRNSDSFLNEPPDAEFNFEKAVIDRHPDLIVMEFVNDAYMNPEQVEQKYSYLLKRFYEIGAEWIILTPHYVRPDWMGCPNDRVETDPRPYVAGIRQFCAKHKVALADASLRWGHLVKEGIPYMTLLVNSINHPNDYGHLLFARAIMELFGGVAKK